MKTRVFIDSSVIIAAIYSAKGYSFDLLLIGVKGDITIIISDDVVDETMKNVAKDRTDKIPALQKALQASNFEIVTVTSEDVIDAADYIHAPILTPAEAFKRINLTL